MRFHLEQRLPGSVAEVMGALVDPRFIASLGRLGDLGEPELLDQRTEDGIVHQRVRYRFTGKLSSAVTRVIDPARLTWVDECAYDLAAGSARFRIVPDHYANRLRCSGRYHFDEEASDRTRRSAEGELSVSYPLVGRAVERAIVSGLESHFDDEAALFEEWLAP